MCFNRSQDIQNSIISLCNNIKINNNRFLFCTKALGLVCICTLRAYVDSDRPHPRCSETTQGCHTRQHSPKQSAELLTV